MTRDCICSKTEGTALFGIVRHQFFSRVNQEQAIPGVLERYDDILTAKFHNPVHAASARCEAVTLSYDEDRLSTSTRGHHRRERINFRMHVMASKAVFHIAATIDLVVLR